MKDHAAAADNADSQYAVQLHAFAQHQRNPTLNPIAMQLVDIQTGTVLETAKGLVFIFCANGNVTQLSAELCTMYIAHEYKQVYHVENNDMYRMYIVYTSEMCYQHKMHGDVVTGRSITHAQLFTFSP